MYAQVDFICETGHTSHYWLVIVFENSLNRLCALALLNVFIIGCKGAVEEPVASVPANIRIIFI